MTRDDVVVVPRVATPEMLEPFARVLCSALQIDPDEPEHPHGEWPTWYGQCAPLAAAYAAALAASPSASADRGGLREKVARAIFDIEHSDCTRPVPDIHPPHALYYRHADAILALVSPALQQKGEDR